MRRAREDILRAIAAARGPASAPSRYRFPAPVPHDLMALFSTKAREAEADITMLASAHEAPAAIESLLVTAKAQLRLHLPQDSPLRVLPWRSAPALVITADNPGAEDSALSQADFAIAETGTLVFASGRHRPASWHFLPGREIVLLARSEIVPAMEDAFARLMESAFPSTVNLVTGPSRTGDIEQTIERGAHGPRAVHILICG